MLSLDSTTLAQYAAASTYDARAQAIMAALPDMVEVKVYNSGGLVGSGTMSTPWATIAGPVITVGTIASFIVQTTGTPNPSTWYLRFESGTKWLRGTFGLSGSGADFTWSRPVWKAGQRGRIASVSITTPRFDVRTAAFAPTESADAAAFAATAPAGWDTIPNQSLTVGVAYSLALADYDPPNTGLYGVNAGGDTLPAGLSLDTATGVISGTPTTAQTKNVAFDAISAASLDVTLTLTGGGSGKAWTFGHAFKQGDVPSGNYITATGPSSFQAEVRNTWADGSVKYAVLSGVGGTSAVLSGTSTAPSGSNVAEPSTTATVQFSSPATTVSLATARTNGSMSWSKTTAHKVREILGPVMSEFHYYSPVSGDNHLAVWWFVRAYSNGSVEVETVVENGWLNVASSTSKSYTVTVVVDGTTRYGPTALTHLHHTRWQRTDWVGTDPAVTPSHDSAYLRSTYLVPNYTTAYGAPSSATLNALVQTAEPFAQAAFPSSMGAAGGGGCILNNWEALYVTSADARAYRSTIANSQAAGRYGIHYRDETTGNPPLYASYTTYGYDGSGISDCGSVLTTFPTGGTAPPNYAKSHARPMGYLAYLLTGRHSFREQVEFQAQVSNFATNYTSTFEGVRYPHVASGAFTTRGAAWAIRSFAAAVVCVPDGDSRAGQYRAQLGKTFGYYGANYTGQNALGILIGYSSYNSGVTTDYTSFMEDSFTMASAWAYQVANEQLGSDRARADAFVLWRASHIVGRMGTQSGFCYRDAATYTVRYASTDLSGTSAATFNAGVYSDWATVYTNTVGTNTCNASTTLNGSSGGAPSILSTDGYPYWGLVHTALAFAVDLGITGASDAWTRYTSAPNYAPSGFNELPLWGVVPR